MSRSIDKNQSDLFTIFGGVYVPDHRTDNSSRYRENSDAQSREIGVAGLWLVFYAVIAGVAIFNQGGAGTAVYLASTVLN